MTCFIKMNARTGATKIKPGSEEDRGFPADQSGRNAAAFSEAFKKEALTEKKGCKRQDSQPERIYGLAVSAE